MNRLEQVELQWAMRLADRVRTLRVRAGLTQAMLANRAGITAETVARLERVIRNQPSANQNPSLQTLARLSEALGVDLKELFDHHEPLDSEGQRLTFLLRDATPVTRNRIVKIAELLVKEDAPEATRMRKRRRRDEPTKQR